MVCPWRVELLEPRGCQLIPSSLLLHPQSLPSSQLLPAPSTGLSLILLPSCSIPSPISNPGSFLCGLNLNSGRDEGVKPALNLFPTAWEAWGVLEGFEGRCEDLGVLGRGDEMWFPHQGNSSLVSSAGVSQSAPAARGHSCHVCHVCALPWAEQGDFLSRSHPKFSLPSLLRPSELEKSPGSDPIHVRFLRAGKKPRK